MHCGEKGVNEARKAYASPKRIKVERPVTARDAKVLDHLVTIDEVEKRSGLDFLWELPDTQEMRIESQFNMEWAEINF